MVYLLGDNDLEEEALIDLGEMATVPVSNDLSIVALADRADGYTDEEIPDIGDWVGAKTLQLGGGEAVELDDHGVLNLGDPDTLAEFIETTVASHAADHYALVLWDHGAGWIGIGPDESHNDLLEVAEIQQGISDGIERADIDGLDLIGIDACAMATYEVATALEGLGSYFVASEELEPGHGWDYRALASAADGQMTTQQVGELLLDGYLDQAREYDQHRQVTLSMVDLRSLAPLHEALGALAEAFDDDAATLASAFGTQRSETLSFARDPNPSNDLHLADLGAFTSGLALLAPDVGDLAAAVDEAVADAVIAQVRGPAARRASGMAVYFPQFPEHAHPSYDRVAGHTEWGRVLSSYLDAGSAIPEEAQPEFLNTDRVAEWFFDEDGLNVIGTFDLAARDNIVDVIIYYGLPDHSDGSIIFFGEEPGELVDGDEGFAGAIYDLTLLQLSDGEDAAFAYLDLTLDIEENIAYFDVPLAYYPPGSDEYLDVVLSVVLDLDTEDFTETYYMFNESGSVGELDAEPNAIIVPIVLNQYPDGSLEWIPTSDVGLWADLPNITYEFVPFESGEEVYAELTVFDYGGNSDFVSVLDTVP